MCIYIYVKWIRVCDEKSLKEGDIIGFHYYKDNNSSRSDKTNKEKLLVAKIQGKIYAADGICTHQYAELSNGFLNEKQKTVTCPIHLSPFSLESGVSLNPPAEEALKTYQIKINEKDS